MSDQDLQQRFTQLAQRSSRAKISALLLLLVSLFIVWSALTSGTTTAEQVDKDFCLRITNDPYYYPHNTGLQSMFCDQFYTARNTIRMTRYLRDAEVPNLKAMSPAEQLKYFRDSTEHFQQFEDYDWNRRQAYRIELSLPYTKNPVPLNGAVISDVWPFGALLLLSVALALGFRQTCYEIHLSALVADEKTKDTHGRDYALGEFATGEITEVQTGGQPAFLYRRPIVLFPETVFSGVLFVAVSVLSLNILTDYGPQFTERGAELFGDSYYFLLYLFAVGLWWLLWKTWKLWRGSVNEAMGGEVSSARLSFLRRGLGFLRRGSVARIRLERVSTCIFAILGLGSLFLHWDDSYRGFKLLYRPTQIFDDAPLTARAVQVVMLFAVVFLILSPLSRLPARIWRGRFLAIVQKARSLGAWIVLICSGYVVFYVAVGLYGYFKDSYAWPTIGSYNYEASMNLQNLPAPADTDFSPAFIVFLCSCGILALLEIAFDAQRRIAQERRRLPEATEGIK
jgi:hypothetical protein